MSMPGVREAFENMKRFEEIKHEPKAPPQISGNKKSPPPKEVNQAEQPQVTAIVQRGHPAITPAVPAHAYADALETLGIAIAMVGAMFVGLFIAGMMR